MKLWSRQFAPIVVFSLLALLVVHIFPLHAWAVKSTQLLPLLPELSMVSVFTLGLGLIGLSRWLRRRL